jgi:voltage-gated sodium channel
MASWCRRLVDQPQFQRAVLLLIIVNAALMGLETWPALQQRWSATFALANSVVQALFLAEIAVRIAAHGRKPLTFFRSGWNVFDFVVVTLSLLPTAGAFATVARLARVLRVARMVSGLPELRLIIGTMLRSIPSMGNVVLLLGLLIYVYGVIGHHLFAAVDVEHWGSLGRAAHTLFVIITLEGWVEIMQKSAQATSWAWLYYASFIVIAVFVVINLFIAVVINNLEKVRSEEAAADAATAKEDVANELRALREQLDNLTKGIRELKAGLFSKRPPPW